MTTAVISFSFGLLANLIWIVWNNFLLVCTTLKKKSTKKPWIKAVQLTKLVVISFMLKFLITIILLLNETKEKTNSRYKLSTKTALTRKGIYFTTTLTAASFRYNDQYYEYVNLCLIYLINIKKF